MDVVLRTRKGYLNIDNGIKIVAQKKDATIMDLSKVSKKKEDVYTAKPLIGVITTERYLNP